MKRLVLLIATATLWGQTQAVAPQLVQKEWDQLGARMVQLMESTAFAVPGLLQASQPVRQSADATQAAMRAAPQNPALTYRFLSEVNAYLALAASMPRPDPFPPAADQQAAELRDGVQRMRRHFETMLQIQAQTTQTHDADPGDLKRYADADAKLLPAVKNTRVVFTGDSVTDYWRLNEYFTGRDFVNRGIAGQNTTQVLARFRQDVLSLNPRAVVILAGINDIGGGLGTRQTQDNLAMMGDLAKAHGIHVAFASVLPVSDYHKAADPAFEMTKTRPPAAIQALNRWIENYCRTEGFIYVNYYAVMVDPGGQLQADLSDDGLHPNAKGYRVMSPVALEAVTRALADQPEDTQPKRRFRLLGR